MIEKTLFAVLDGQEIYSYKLTSGKAYAEILNYGGVVKNLCVEDKDGNLVDVVLGYDDLDGYRKNGGYLCALIGRFGNRIEKGKLVIDGKEYELYKNDRGNHLHGGKVGFDSKIWSVKEDGNKLVLSYLSKDGEENYPGNLQVQVVYSFENNALKIEYTAVSDKKTAINLTNHSYFNLDGGEENGSILGHTLFIDANKITPTDENMIPHGEFRNVENTPFDFRKPKKIVDGDKEKTTDPDLKNGGGFDHCFVFEKNRDVSKPYAIAIAEKTCIKMECFTDMPAVQLYCGNGLNAYGKGGKHYGKNNAFCLETQAIPNNVNVKKYADYGSSIYDAGETYHFTAEYRFSVVK